MKKTNRLIAAVAAAGAAGLLPSALFAADRVGDFSLLDQDGYHHSMSWYDDHKTIALLLQANDSAATAAANRHQPTAPRKSGHAAPNRRFDVINRHG